MKRLFGCAIVLTLMLGATLAADVQTQQKSQMKMEGMLGRMMGLFGGKAAKEGLVQTIAVSGDRKVTMGDSTAQIVDLAEEKVYDLDLNKKTYKVTTFEELRKQMQEAAAKAQKSESKGDHKEYDFDLDVKNTGQRKTINSYDCAETLVTVTVHEKGKTLEQAGGLVLTTDMWLTKAVPALKEVQDFEKKYAEKMLGGDAAQQMAAAAAMYPGLKDAMAKMQANTATIDGSPIQMTMTVASALTPEQQKANDQKADQKTESANPVSNVLGGLGRFGRKKNDQPAAAPSGDKAAPAADKSRATIMTVTNEVLSVSTSVDKTALAVPAGFKQK